MDKVWIFNRPNEKHTQLFRGPSYRGFDIFCFVSYGNQLFFRIVNSFVEPDFEITSDPRQDGQSSPFTTSSQKGHEMRNCRDFIVAERETSPLSRSISAYIHCCLIFRVRKVTSGCFDRRPILNRPLSRLAKPADGQSTCACRLTQP